MGKWKAFFLQLSTSKSSFHAGQLIPTEQDGSGTAHPICAAETIEVNCCAGPEPTASWPPKKQKTQVYNFGH